MKNESEIKEFYDVLLSSLPKETIPILRAVFFSIREGRPVSEDFLAKQTGIETKTVESVVEILAQRQMIVRGDNRKIVGALGLSIIPTNNKIQMAGRTLFAWCAISTLELSTALEADVDIHSNCAYTGESIEVTVRNGKLEKVTPDSTVIWTVPFDSEAPWAGGTCKQIHYFSSVEHANKWKEQHPKLQGEIMTLEQALSMGEALKHFLS